MARALAGQLEWDDARSEREIADWHKLASAEGLMPRAAATAPAGGAPRPEPSPTAPGAAPEEAA